MSDLRGYTRFAEQGDPAWVMELLNDFLARMTDIIIAYGGTINEFIGDAIFAVYGAPSRTTITLSVPQRQRSPCNAPWLSSIRSTPSAAGRVSRWALASIQERRWSATSAPSSAKYAVVGAAVNLAARVEGCTVEGRFS